MTWHHKDREPAAEGDRGLPAAVEEWAEAAVLAPEEIVFVPIAGKRCRTNVERRALRPNAQNAARQ